MNLIEIQRASQEQFARQSHRYGRGHILENVDAVRAALETITLPARAQILDVATGAGHTGLYLASLGHDVILADRAQQAAEERGFRVRTRQHPAGNASVTAGMVHGMASSARRWHTCSHV